MQQVTASHPTKILKIMIGQNFIIFFQPNW